MSDKNVQIGTILPKLVGSKKQLGWAYKIREKYSKENPDSELLSIVDAAYWVDNRGSLIGDSKLPKTLPQLEGSEAQIKWAFAIRSKVSDVFPECMMLRSHTDAKFWIENRRLFDFAILGFELAPAEGVSPKK